jgi:hypothetical protein
LQKTSASSMDDSAADRSSLTLVIRSAACSGATPADLAKAGGWLPPRFDPAPTAPALLAKVRLMPHALPILHPAPPEPPPPRYA